MLTLRYVPELDDIVELMAMSPERRRLRRRAVRNAAVSLVPLCAVLWVGVAERTPGALPVLPICAAISGSYLQRARAPPPAGACAAVRAESGTVHPRCGGRTRRRSPRKP